MSEAFIGEIRLFAGNYEPQDWALCNGQLLSIQQNQVLFTLLGTTYGGDGVNTFALPDLRGRVPVGAGAGPGLTQRNLGQAMGSAQTSIGVQHMPAHSHTFYASTQLADAASPVDTQPPASRTLGVFTAQSSTKGLYSNGGTNPNVTLNSAAVSVAPGGGQPHANLMGSMALNYIIALAGIYPSQQ